MGNARLVRPEVLVGRILVIDDDESSRDVLVRRLRRSGYQVDAAKDGESGIEEARKQRPDLVLVDIRLGGIDGWQVIEHIRDQRDTDEPAFISMTAYDGSEYLPRSAQVGCRHALTIPYLYQHLLECVADCVGEQAGHRSHARPAA